LHLNEEELAVIRRATAPIHWSRHAQFLNDVVRELKAHGLEATAHGPATVADIVATVQHRYVREMVGKPNTFRKRRAAVGE
jgi:hypothetical protein